MSIVDELEKALAAAMASDLGESEITLAEDDWASLLVQLDKLEAALPTDFSAANDTAVQTWIDEYQAVHSSVWQHESAEAQTVAEIIASEQAARRQRRLSPSRSCSMARTIYDLVYRTMRGSHNHEEQWEGMVSYVSGLLDDDTYRPWALKAMESYDAREAGR